MAAVLAELFPVRRDSSMTPAAFRHIGTIYESCTARGLDLTAIRHHAASRGLARTPAQVAYDLDTVFSFAGYTASHQPAPALSVKEFDAQIGS
jgi:hypothetical protein